MRMRHILNLLIILSLASCGGSGSGSEAETIIRVLASCNGLEGANETCSLDDAIAQAAASGNATIVLEPGEYDLTAAITNGMTLESASFEAASALALPLSKSAAVFSDCEIPSVEITTASTPDVIIRGNEDDATLRVAMSLPDDVLILNGIEVRSGSNQSAVRVTSGGISFEGAILSGGLILDGETALGSATGLRLGDSDLDLDELLVHPPSSRELYMNRVCNRAALSVQNGAVFTGIDLEITDHRVLGVCVDDATATLCGGSVHDIDLNKNGIYGRGAEVSNTGTFTVKGTHFFNNREVDILADGSGTTLTVNGGAILENNTRSDAEINASFGIVAQGQAQASLDDVIMRGIEGPGLYLTTGAQVTAVRTTCDHSSIAAILVDGATLDLTQGQLGNGGFGMLIQNRAESSTVTVANSIFDKNREAGIFVDGDGGSILVKGNRIINSKAIDLGGFPVMGHGVFVRDSCSGVTLSNNTYEGNQGAHVFLHHSNAALPDLSAYITNGVLDFKQQVCTDCVIPFDPAFLDTRGLTPAHIVDLCPAGQELVVENDFVLYFGEVAAQFGR